MCLGREVSGARELGSLCIVTGPSCFHPGFGGLGVLPGVATGTGLNPKSRMETKWYYLAAWQCFFIHDIKYTAIWGCLVVKRQIKTLILICVSIVPGGGQGGAGTGYYISTNALKRRTLGSISRTLIVIYYIPIQQEAVATVDQCNPGCSMDIRSKHPKCQVWTDKSKSRSSHVASPVWPPLVLQL